MLPDEKLGQLALYRTLLVKNKHLAILAQRLDLKKYILTNVPCRNSEPLPSDSMATATPDPLEAAGPLSMDAVAHTNANTLEAVIGAVFVDAGLSVAQELIARLFFPEEVCRMSSRLINIHEVQYFLTGSAQSLDGLSTRSSTGIKLGTSCNYIMCSVVLVETLPPFRVNTLTVTAI